MNPVTALLESDRWHWVIDHGAALVLIVLGVSVLTATATWLVLRVRYRMMTREQRLALREFEDKLQGATADETRRRLESLQARLDRLEPRRLTKRQKTVLEGHLPLPEAAGLTRINVAYDATCGDGKQYAADLARVLSGCRGWRPSNGTVFGWGRKMASGLAIVCSKHGRTAAAAKVLAKALAAAGIDYETIYSPEEELELVIASRQLAPEMLADD